MRPAHRRKTTARAGPSRAWHSDRALPRHRAVRLHLWKKRWSHSDSVVAWRERPRPKGNLRGRRDRDTFRGAENNRGTNHDVARSRHPRLTDKREWGRRT